MAWNAHQVEASSALDAECTNEVVVYTIEPQTLRSRADSRPDVSVVVLDN